MQLNCCSVFQTHTGRGRWWRKRVEEWRKDGSELRNAGYRWAITVFIKVSTIKAVVEIPLGNLSNIYSAYSWAIVEYQHQNQNLEIFNVRLHIHILAYQSGKCSCRRGVCEIVSNLSASIVVTFVNKCRSNQKKWKCCNKTIASQETFLTPTKLNVLGDKSKLFRDSLRK